MPNRKALPFLSLALLTGLLVGMLRPGAAGTVLAQDATSTPEAPAATDTPVPPASPTPFPTVTPQRVIFPTITRTPEVTEVVSATEFIDDGSWSPPVNLSQSGAASRPVITADARGYFYALWWDNFDGTHFSVYRPEQGWSRPVNVPAIVGARSTAVNTPPTAPTGLRLFASDDNVLHAFWIDARGALMYASSNQRAGTEATWSTPLQLATQPFVWDAQVDAGGVLHVAYIRKLQTTALPAGIYYRQSITSGRRWETARALVTSLYFRTLPDSAAHVDVAANGAGEVFVAWDDPQLFYSFYSRSGDGGRTFEAPVGLTPTENITGNIPRRLRLLEKQDGSYMRLWQASDSCALYQESYDATANAWSTPTRILEQLSGCLTEAQSFALDDGRMLLFAGLTEGTSAAALALWDGERWSDPWAPRIGFVNPTTNRPTVLECLTADLYGEQLAVLGCDPRGDVWATTSQISLTLLLPKLTTAWSPPVQLSDLEGEAGFAAVTHDGEARMHVLWSQRVPDGPADPLLYYTRGDGVTWATGVNVLRTPSGGPAGDPLVLSDQNGYLHAVWSGGLAGEIFYSRSFARDAGNTTGWLAPRRLPSPQPVGGWPALDIDANNVLRVVYAIPLNESRGVYYVESTDRGDNWSDPRVVFDASAAGWAAVQDTQLVTDGAGRLHVLFGRHSLPPAAETQGVYYVRSTDGGLTWSAPAEVSGGSAGNGRLVATRPDELHRFWTEAIAGDFSLYHQWSADAGETWSNAVRVPGLRAISPNVALASDGNGALYLVGIETTLQGSAALFYLQWDGQAWINQESMPLGFNTDAASGVRVLLLPPNRLAAFYRVTTSPNPGGGLHVMGYTERQVDAVKIVVAPTFTPVPTLAPTVTPTTAPSSTPEPTANLSVEPAPAVSDDVWLRIGGILAGMAAVVVVAVIGLRASRR
jgi:hypothetical protein